MFRRAQGGGRVIDWLDSVENRINADDQPLYPLDLAKAKYDVRELIPDTGWLVIFHDTSGGSWLRFAVLRFAVSEVGGRDIQTAIVFHGEGPSGSLRECRHTYWGEDGYLFYPDGPVIVAALKALSEFYDDLI